MSGPGEGIDVDICTWNEEKDNEDVYLPVAGELHYKLNCSWDRSKEEQSVLHNGVPRKAYVHTRSCRCDAQLPKTSEHHFEIGCKWVRVKDSQFDFKTQQKVYIYRKCQCEEPKNI